MSPMDTDIEHLLNAAAIRHRRDAGGPRLPALSQCYASRWPGALASEPDLRPTVRPVRRGRP